MLRIVYESDGSRSFSIDGKDVTEEEANKQYPNKKCDRVPMIAAAIDQNWERENGGMGKYLPQAGPRFLDAKTKQVPNPQAYARSRSEAIERYKERGYPDIQRD